MAAEPLPAAAPSATVRPLRAAVRPVPARSVEFDHLGLTGLRSYRAALTHEEGQVSYWRRILQARLDLMTGNPPSRHLDTRALGSMLSEDRVGPGRRALMQITPADDIPPLPNLASLWSRQPSPYDAAAVAALIDDLAAAEAELSAYRSALHRRIAAATGELIARYREEPTLCLSALPLTEHQPGHCAVG